MSNVPHPYSDAAKFLAGGLWAATTVAEVAANYPALKHWWPVRNVSGKNITDAAPGNVTLNSTANFALGSGGYAGSGIPVLVGTFTNPGASPFILIATGVFNSPYASAIFEYGDPAGNGPGASIQGTSGAGLTNYIAKDATNYQTFTSVSPANSLAFATSRSANVSKQYTTTASAIATNTGAVTTGDISGAWSAIPQQHTIANNIGSIIIKDIYFWVFTTLPADIPAAVAWMGANPGKPYPGWKGLA